MAKYKVLEESFFAGGLVQAGDVVEYNGKGHGKLGANFELIREALPKARDKAVAGEDLPEPGAELESEPAFPELVTQTVL